MIDRPATGNSDRTGNTTRGRRRASHENAQIFDLEYDAIANDGLVWLLAAEAFGEEYPSEVQPWGMTTWWLLGRLVAGCRLAPGELVVDVGCGRGGPGLWLARATGADLVGIDVSAVAVQQAGDRTADFVPVGRARFFVDDFTSSAVSDGAASAVISLDAIHFADDLAAALSNVYRMLRVGGRFALTATETPQSGHPVRVADWTRVLEACGFVVESKEPVAGFVAHLQAMQRVWSANVDRLRNAYGATVASGFLQRANGLAMVDHQPVFVLARRGG